MAIQLYKNKQAQAPRLSYQHPFNLQLKLFQSALYQIQFLIFEKDTKNSALALETLKNLVFSKPQLASEFIYIFLSFVTKIRAILMLHWYRLVQDVDCYFWNLINVKALLESNCIELQEDIISHIFSDRILLWRNWNKY